ncbi:MAG: DNA topoisomerase VI subunit B [Phycisphaerales bacterium JB037]
MSQKPSKSPPRATAESMAEKQREISVSEFFAKNRHLLGFDNPRKALLTTVKEAVDNALDACEEAGILPDILVKIEELEAPPSASKPGRYRVTIGDNGPGIVRKQVENIFGKLLYGSKFHRLKMSRGQQGIGISAAGMYGLMTTGKPMVITTRPNRRKPAHHIELAMDTTRNKPEVSVDVETEDFEPTSSGTGTTVSIELEARYQRGKVSVLTYLEQTAIANPHAEIVFIPPGKGAGDDDGPTLEASRDREGAETDSNGTGESRSGTKQPIPDGRGSPDEIVRTIEADGKIIFPRTVEELPAETSEIRPHPYGVELGTFLRMLKQTDEKHLGGFLKNEFCRVAPKVASEVYKDASTKSHSVSGQTWVKSIDHATAERLYKALQASKLRAPPTDCLSPIGVRQMLAGLLKGVRAEFYAAATRPPSVYRGMPFQIEAAIAFGGDLPSSENGQTEPARVIRFANRVPLLYQQSACSAFKSVTETAWRNYGITQPRGGAPVGPLVIMIHMASVWVPFTSESKEAIADYDEIRKEMKLALQECGRKLGTYMRRRQRMKREGQRRDIFERYIGEIARACAALTEVDAAELYEALKRQAQRRTEIADAELDDEGNFIKSAKNSSRNGGNGRLDDDDGVLIVDSPSGPTPGGGALEDEGSREVKPAKRGAKGSSKKTKKKSVRKKKPRPEGAASGGLFGSEG